MARNIDYVNLVAIVVISKYRAFILEQAQVYSFITPDCCTLPGSDAGNDGIEPASGFVIQNRQTLCSM